MELDIAMLMARMAKFEFFMIKSDKKLAQVNGAGKVEGFQYCILANRIENVVPFNTFDFNASGFHVFKNEPPQYLIFRDETLKWDSDQIEINSWKMLLTRSYAQLRNNLAHGSKSLQAAQFTHDRTPIYLKAGDAMIDFIASKVFLSPHWEGQLKCT